MSSAPHGLLDESLNKFSYSGLGHPMDFIRRHLNCCNSHTADSLLPPWYPALKMTTPLLDPDWFYDTLEFTWKVLRLPYWIWTDFMIYWTWIWKTPGLTYWTEIDFIITRQNCWLRINTCWNYLLVVSNKIEFRKFDYFPESDYVWCLKHQMLMLSGAKLSICRIQQELPKFESNLIPFKG